MGIIEQGQIVDEETIKRLGIWDTYRALGTYASLSQDHILRSLYVCCAGTFMYTALESDLTVYPEAPGWPDWHHVGPSHEQLGRLYWNAFHATQEGELYFNDAPDFSGTLITNGQSHRFWGDIGQINAMTWMLDVWSGFLPGDLWISILDEHHQIILEAQPSISDRQKAVLESIRSTYGQH